MDWVGRTLALLVAAAALLTAWLAASAAAQAIISNGAVQLGVAREGNLIVDGGSASCWPAGGPGASPPGGTPPGGTPPRSASPPCSPGGTTKVGIRDLATNGEAIADGCACETWGVGYGGTFAGGPGTVAPVSFTRTASRATSVVRAADLTVTHEFHPSVARELYEVGVALENTGPTTLYDVRYRRAMDWDVQPTSFHEFVTIGWTGPGTVDLLVSSSTDGFVSGNPYVGPGSRYKASVPTAPELTDEGPADHGSEFVFAFGDIRPRQTVVFSMYYGAASNESAAYAALRRVDAAVWSLGQPSNLGGPDPGEPSTFIFAFGRVDERVMTSRPPIARAQAVPEDDCNGDLFFLQSAGSHDPEGGPLTYHWDFGDGGVGHGHEVWHHYPQPGMYTVNLTVTDEYGLSAWTHTSLVSAGDRDCCPVLQAPWRATTTVGRELRMRLQVHDPDGGRADLGAFDVPQGLRLADGVITWTPRPDQQGDHRGRVAVTVGACTQSHPLRITVLPPSDAVAPDDLDQDGVADDQDNCPSTPNTDQADADLDGLGDACTTHGDPGGGAIGAGDGQAASDADHDGVADLLDACPRAADPDQADLDRDTVGDACDPDRDGDGVAEAGAFPDVCPLVPDPDQADADRDGAGDACDAGAPGRRAQAPDADAARLRRAPDGRAARSASGAMGAALAALGAAAWAAGRRG